ncbi:MAG: rhomboid family intramembrane serine protease [Candidatus Nezhaarchaeales archaeon]
MSCLRGFGLPIGYTTRPTVRPVMTLGLIVTNTIVYLLTSYENSFLTISSRWIILGGYIPSMLEALDQLYRLLSSMFLHADIFHILFNMYFLYIFGRAIEEALGKWRFLALYLASGVLAALFHTAFSFIGGASAYTIPAIGASGAISGILGAYLILFPGTTLFVGWFFFIIPVFFRMRAAYFLIMWFAMQVAYGYAKIGGIAFFAHAGGFVAGIALLPMFKVRSEGSISRLKLLEELGRLSTHVAFTETSRSIRGLSRGTKIVVALLLTSLLAGAAYASSGLLVEEGLKAITLHYTFEGAQYIDYVGVQKSNIERQLSAIPKSETRILLNRLYAADLLYDEAKAGKELKIDNWHDRVFMSIEKRRVIVDVLMISFTGSYDLDGFLSYGIGELKTQVVLIGQNRVSVTDYMVHYIFEVTSKTVNIENILRITGLISLITSALALLVVLTKDKELTLVGE